MLTLQKSDVFQTIQSGNSIKQKINGIVLNQHGYREVDNRLAFQYDMINRNFKETIVPKIFAAVRDKSLLVKFSPDPSYRLPIYMPFFKYYEGGVPKVILDLSQYLVIRPNASADFDLEIDVTKLYALMESAFICLKIADQSHIIPATAAEYGSKMWAQLFTKVLNKAIGLYTNQERYNAFKYFATKFYLLYYLDYPEKAVDSITKNLCGEKSILIQEIEMTLHERDVNPYTSFDIFCETMFNNDITHVRFGAVGTKINIHYYLTKFVDMFGSAALLSLASFPYFVYLIIGANTRSYLFNQKILEDVCMNRKDYVNFITSIYTDLS